MFKSTTTEAVYTPGEAPPSKSELVLLTTLGFTIKTIAALCKVDENIIRDILKK